MNKTKYKVRHVACNMSDFMHDCHRFRFEYNGKESIAECYGAVSVVFLADVPYDVRDEVTKIIHAKIDRDEYKWRYPQEAYEIADEYCDERR